MIQPKEFKWMKQKKAWKQTLFQSTSCLGEWWGGKVTASFLSIGFVVRMRRRQSVVFCLRDKVTSLKHVTHSERATLRYEDEWMYLMFKSWRDDSISSIKEAKLLKKLKSDQGILFSCRETFSIKKTRSTLIGVL